MAKDNSNAPPRNAPDTAFLHARREWFERMGSPIVDKNRWAFIAFIELLVIIALVIAISYLVPLVRVVPYVVKVDDAGKAAASSVMAQEYKPSNAHINYFVAEWVRKWQSIDPATLSKDLTGAFTLVRSRAIDEFREWIREDKPVERLNKSAGTLTRVVKIVSVTPVNDNVVQVRFMTIERDGSSDVKTKNKVALVHFALIQPKSEEEILQNPLGLFVSHFALSEEIN